MSQEHLTFIFYSISVFQLFSQSVPGEPHSHSVCPSCTYSPAAWPWWPRLPESGHSLYLVVTKPGQDVHLRPSPAPLNSFIRPLRDQIFLGRSCCPWCCCGCRWLHCVEPLPAGMVPGCVAPQLNTVPGLNMSTGPNRMSSESTVWRAFVPLLLLFFLNTSCFLGLQITDTACLSVVSIAPFSHHHPVFEGIEVLRSFKIQG